MADDSPSPELLPVALREALRRSPDNVPLLLHAGETVLKLGSSTEAEALFKRALALEPDQTAARLGLASAFFQQGKSSAALVIVEDLVTKPTVSPQAWLLHARLALSAGEPRLAAQQYRRARQADPALADSELERELGNYLPASPPLSLPPRQPPAPPSSPDETEAERLPAGDLPDDPTSEMDRPTLTFADVGGMEAVKEEIRMKIILPLTQGMLYELYGKKSGGGILLYGPPGCGKTYLARATAGEVRAGFLAVGISDVLDMWIGQSEKNLHAIFEQARAHRPCVLFFDEVDALGANRTDMLKSGGRQIINQFLSELDGVKSSNEGVLILAATNAPWHLDPAFRRPGRFDRILFVPPPDLAARTQILKILLKGRPAEDIDCPALAKKSEGYSGADLKAVVDIAVEEKLRESIRANSLRKLTQRDLAETMRRYKPTVKDWFETARNYALYANKSGLYDDILAYLKISP